MSDGVGAAHGGGYQPRPRRPFAIAQLGGPTAVINMSLWGFLAATKDREVLAVRRGPTGLLNADLVPLRADLVPGATATGDESIAVTEQLAARPGALLGAGRLRLSPADVETIAASLIRAGLAGIALIGGNGTMSLASGLHEVAAASGSALSVVGIPKTVDNDLAGTDHAPGYPSAARFVVEAVRDLELDLIAMSSIEQVRIVETLGRRSGWLALASLAARAEGIGAPHLVYVPEIRMDEESFLADVAAVVKRHGHALVVVAEGIWTPSSESPFVQDRYDRPIGGGVARRLAELVETHLDYGTRAEVLGVLQRCAGFAVSSVDQHEAFALGAEAARLLLEGTSGVMVALSRRANGPSELTTVPLSDVAGRTRPVPDRLLAPLTPRDHGIRFVEWLKPLLGAA